MRFFVEVTPIGQTETQRYCVEASSWQVALQNTRTLRNDLGPISGFSIELTDEGCRAVDPMARLRFMVKQAPDAAPLTGERVSEAPTKIQDSPLFKEQVAATLAASAPSEKMPASKRVPVPSRTIAYGAAAVATREPPPKVIPPAPVTKPTLSNDHNARVLFHREQDPTAASPLTYREDVLAVTAGTSEDEAATILRKHLDFVQNAIIDARPGKYVNLAIFDQIFEGRPPVLPLVILSWKDWQGEAVQSFPRRGKAAAGPTQVSSNMAPAAAQAIAAAVPAFPPRAAPVAPVAPSVPALQVAAPIAAPPAPAQQAPSRPPPGIAALAAAFPPSVHPAPTPPVVAPALSATPPPVHAETPAPKGSTESARLRFSRPPSGPSFARVRGDELIAILFEEMHDVHFLTDAIEGGAFCLGLALEKLPSRAGIVHLYDINKREFVIVTAFGKGTEQLLSRRHGDKDPLLSAAMRKRNSLVMNEANKNDAAFVERYELIGGAKSLIVSPVLKDGRFLGAIELINPLDGAPFTEADGNAITYMSEQYAEFISVRGVVTDPDRIAAHAAARPR